MVFDTLKNLRNEKVFEMILFLTIEFENEISHEKQLNLKKIVKVI